MSGFAWNCFLFLVPSINLLDFGGWSRLRCGSDLVRTDLHETFTRGLIRAEDQSNTFRITIRIMIRIAIINFGRGLQSLWLTLYSYGIYTAVRRQNAISVFLQSIIPHITYNVHSFGGNNQANTTCWLNVAMLRFQPCVNHMGWGGMPRFYLSSGEKLKKSKLTL